MRTEDHRSQGKQTTEDQRGVLARFWGCRRGAIGTLVAILLPVLIAFGVGMGVELGLWYTAIGI